MYLVIRSDSTYRSETVFLYVVLQGFQASAEARVAEVPAVPPTQVPLYGTLPRATLLKINMAQFALLERPKDHAQTELSSENTTRSATHSEMRMLGRFSTTW